MVSYNIVLKTRQYASFKCYRWEEWGKTPPPPPSPFGIAAGPPQMLLPDTSSGLLPAFSSKAITVLFRREWITQHFQIKPLNPQMSARGCQQSRHQHLQPHSFCHAPPPLISAVTSLQHVSHYHACGIHGGVELLYYKAPFSSSIRHKLPSLWRPKLRTQQASAEKHKYILKKTDLK